ncbi:FKBP-type peptidyl-prolyl cis-trans isomerase [uncultured Polaribacter sp.]|uniref:FKBP-type peptidyl-prolyl cis-trans isomerase N-terminal domain-containing protein n=1 Tax=uncultured Polaribacter sp. TaxID=174711 RepID=UPI00260D6013|nr:FKBP-type peptidyl-prolyl cis-trans isomerase [uncultured Polaribacter sp.]
MKSIKSLVAVVITVSMFSCGNQVKEVKSLETELDSVSYAVGLSMSAQLKSNFEEVNKDLLAQGIRNGLDSTNLLIESKEIQKVLSSFFQKKQMAKMKEQQEKAAKEAELKFGDNKKAGEDFLAENKTKEGVKTTESGLQYIVLKEGKGDFVKATDKIKIHYHGTNIEGKVFDSTVEKNTPYESLANQFIPGFTEGLQLMKEGSKFKFFIPQDIAYGAQQRGADIKPFSALMFEVEILDILEK